MNEKVKVSREVADYIDETLEWARKNIAKRFEGNEREIKSYAFEGIGNIGGFTRFEIAEILINGYEIEETPEEKLLATYQRQRAWQETNDPFDRRAHTAYGNAIVYTLDTLGIKIKGIND